MFLAIIIVGHRDTKAAFSIILSNCSLQTIKILWDYYYFCLGWKQFKGRSSVVQCNSVVENNNYVTATIIATNNMGGTEINRPHCIP